MSDQTNLDNEFELIRAALQADQIETAKELFLDLYPADQAEIFIELHVNRADPTPHDEAMADPHHEPGVQVAEGPDDLGVQGARLLVQGMDQRVEHALEQRRVEALPGPGHRRPSGLTREGRVADHLEVRHREHAAIVARSASSC